MRTGTLIGAALDLDLPAGLGEGLHADDAVRDDDPQRVGRTALAAVRNEEGGAERRPGWDFSGLESDVGLCRRRQEDDERGRAERAADDETGHGFGSLMRTGRARRSQPRAGGPVCGGFEGAARTAAASARTGEDATTNTVGATMSIVGGSTAAAAATVRQVARQHAPSWLGASSDPPGAMAARPAEHIELGREQLRAEALSLRQRPEQPLQHERVDREDHRDEAQRRVAGRGHGGWVDLRRHGVN
jgi:hypothetical protein